MPAADRGHRAAARPGVVIWRVDLVHGTEALLALEAATPRLAESDHQRAAVQGGGDPEHPRARERRAVYIALRLALEQAFGAEAVRGREMQRSELGRPSLAGCPGDFSLAHVSGLALIGVSRHGSIGVDVERLRAVRMSAARRDAIERAGAALDPATALPQDAPHRFLSAWVRLEAFAKAQRISMARVLTVAGALGGVRAPPERDLRDRLCALGSADPATFGDGGAGFSARDLGLAAGLFGAMAWVGEAAVVRSAPPPILLELPEVLVSLGAAVG